MTALHASEVEDRRSHAVRPDNAPSRRVSDSWISRMSWPTFLAFWFAAGLAMLVYLLYLAYYD